MLENLVAFIVVQILNTPGHEIFGFTGTGIRHFLPGRMFGVIGTLGGGEGQKGTPRAFTQRILAHFYQHGMTNVAMEVSSHGLEQGRVNAITFSGGI
ncbi:MAG: hypothetical protein H0A75_01245 [Candidatus Methanofishera endochildressiae]|uniref:Mur ligase central domain-containing protein n=1 Tax=Candidatus Methanofishera endochildressiae TaxID=2738884 RepID=A0A7Z0MMN6_9GAMM|nr:hypothetical protein [Candidatus Methanofishera endochildressiae]